MTMPTGFSVVSLSAESQKWSAGILINRQIAMDAGPWHGTDMVIAWEVCSEAQGLAPRAKRWRPDRALNQPHAILASIITHSAAAPLFHNFRPMNGKAQQWRDDRQFSFWASLVLLSDKLIRRKESNLSTSLCNLLREELHLPSSRVSPPVPVPWGPISCPAACGLRNRQQRAAPGKS